MANYTAPGVYVEEVPSAVKTIAGVGTSTAGFIGIIDSTALIGSTNTSGEYNGAMPIKPGTEPEERYSVKPEGIPFKITSWESFKRNFGNFHQGNSDLAHSVYGFFNNGGSVCYVACIYERSPEGEETSVNYSSDYKAILNEFCKKDDIAIVAAPGEVNTGIQEQIISHCENMKDRFAILDGQRLTDNDQYLLPNITNSLRYSNGGFAAIYFPWIEVTDYAPTDPKNTSLILPPSGHIAGIYARSDGERGVQKAPANEMVRGAIGLEHTLSRVDQGSLNEKGINIIRSFQGNITLWGGRTYANTDKQPEWKYINVRRVFNYICESIEDGTRWVVFEPNDMSLWKKIERNVTAFLTNVWRDGALLGAVQEEAFYVKCDEETNPEEVRILGQVVTEIGVSIVKPAEFVIFRISQG